MTNDLLATVPQLMRAAFIGETGDVNQIQIGQLPVPRPGQDDVLVQMLASAVNHVDLLVRSGAFRCVPYAAALSICDWP